MSVTIYQTSDMESAIKKMAESNKNSVVFDFHWCDRKIRLRMNLLKGVPAKAVRSWDAHADETIKAWNKSGGLLYYKHMQRANKLPDCDALFFVEMPLRLDQFEEFQSHAKKEIIIYRPPDWSMHEDALNFLTPKSSDYENLFGEITRMIGCHDALSRIQKIALQFSGLPPQECAVFNAKSLECMTPIKMRHIIACRKKLFSHYTRYDAYRPVIAPDNKEFMDVYDLMEAQQDAGDGLRFLRFDKPVGEKPPSFGRVLKLLVKSGSIIEYDPVHIFRKGWQKVDADMVDAIYEVKMKSHMRMRSMIENAPIY